MFIVVSTWSGVGCYGFYSALQKSQYDYCFHRFCSTTIIAEDAIGEFVRSGVIEPGTQDVL